MPFATDRSAAILAVRRASAVCRAVRSTLTRDASRLIKDDLSPVTVADFGAQAITSLTLRAHRPGDRIVGEESADALRTDAAKAIRDHIVDHVCSVLAAPSSSGGIGDALGRVERKLGSDAILAAIDACNDAGGRQGRHWVLDPIDGTKGYLRGGQYAVALALMEEGEITLGVLGCPSLPSGPGVAPGCLFVAERGQGTVQIALDSDIDSDDLDSDGLNSDGLNSADPDREDATEPSLSTPKVTVSVLDDPTDAAFCESVEAAHSAHERHARIAGLLGVRAEPVRMDSQCKYGVVARGEAAIYLRLPRTESYREKIWDHAAGWLVVQEAGGRVTDVDGRDLDFGLGRTLDRNRGVVASNGRHHDRVLDAIRRTEPAQEVIRA